MVKVPRERELTDEAIRVLLQHMPAWKVARVLAAWRVGEGDYTAERADLFAGETVDSLVAKVRAYEQEHDLAARTSAKSETQALEPAEV